MPQFMQRAAWSRVSFSESGTTNSLKFFRRSVTGVYFRSCRSISRKPVTLPIISLTPLHHKLVFVVSRHCEERSDEANPILSLLRYGLLRFARNDDVVTTPRLRSSVRRRRWPAFP